MAVNIQKQVDAVLADNDFMRKVQNRFDVVLDNKVSAEIIIKEIVSSRGNLKSTRPEDGYAAYLWRMVAFMISDNRAHNCIPCMADMYIPVKERHARNEVIAILDMIDKKIVDQFNPSQCTGLKAWKGILV